METDETEGLSEDSAGGEEAGTEAGADGPRRKRRRRRRGRGEARESGPAREEDGTARTAPIPAEAAATDESESDEDESEEQPGLARSDPAAGGERRPRRRGRRGGRRRRGGPEDGLAASIVDELGPASAPEVTSAVADFDGYSSVPSPPVVQPETIAPVIEQQPADRSPQEAARTTPETETAQEAERAAARRRSTVREKVSFLANAQPDVAAPVSHSAPQPAAPPASAEPASETTDNQPRRAGWWSRRFGNGE